MKCPLSRACIGKVLAKQPVLYEKRNIVDGTPVKKLILLDGAYNLSRHITVISSNQLRLSIGNTINRCAGTRQPDNRCPSDTAPVPVDEYVVLSFAATIRRDGFVFSTRDTLYRLTHQHQ